MVTKNPNHEIFGIALESSHTEPDGRQSAIMVRPIDQVCGNWQQSDVQPDSVFVTILDTHTGRIAQSDWPFTHGWWREGNGSCDCNRETLFYEAPCDGVCRGCHRFLIVAVQPMPSEFTLADFNEGYPIELLERFLPQ